MVLLKNIWKSQTLLLPMSLMQWVTSTLTNWMCCCDNVSSLYLCDTAWEPCTCDIVPVWHCRRTLYLWHCLRSETQRRRWAGWWSWKSRFLGNVRNPGWGCSGWQGKVQQQQGPHCRSPGCLRMDTWAHSSTFFTTWQTTWGPTLRVIYEIHHW